MGKRKVEFEVVPESEHTDFSDRVKPSNGALLGVGIAATASLTTYAVTRIVNYSRSAVVVPEIAPVITPPVETVEPFNVLSQFPETIPVNAMPEVIQTGVVADASLNMLANVLDPLIQIMVAVSFPIASVIMIGSCFYFMFGNSEKAWDSIGKAALGYVVIQLSPLFLSILRNVGESVVPS